MSNGAPTLRGGEHGLLAGFRFDDRQPTVAPYSPQSVDITENMDLHSLRGFVS